MACEVTLKDIKSEIKNGIIDEFPSGKPSNASSSVFIAYTAKNRQTLSSDVNSVVKNINKEYNPTVYGNVVTAESLEFGVNLNINPSQELADAMTTQNYNDEFKRDMNNDFYLGDNALRDQEMNSRRGSTVAPLQKPVTDNFVEFIAYKNSQLNEVNKEITQLNKEIKNPPVSTIETQKQLKEALFRRSTIETQIDNLRKNEVNLMFHAIVTDFDNITEALRTPGVSKGEDIKNKLKFYTQIMTGVVAGVTNTPTDIQSLQHFNHPDYNALLARLTTLQTAYMESVPKNAQDIIFNNSTVQKNILDNPDIDEANLFTPRKDISMIDKYGYGINESYADNTIIPQVIYSEFQKLNLEETTTVQKMILGLRDFLTKTNIKNFDFIFEKDAKGRPTGYITNVFSPTWYTALKSYNAKYINFLTDKSASNYKSTIDWLRQNANLVDFRQLKEFKDVYGQQYADHFTYDDATMSRYETNLRAQLGPKYDKVVSQLHDKLANFEYIKEQQLASTSIFKFNAIASKDIWAFNKAFHDNSNVTKKINFNAGGVNTEETYFTDFNGLTFVPKQTELLTSDMGVDEVSTGYYSEAYKEIMKNPDKLEYSNKVEEMSGYINNTYQTEFHDRMSYPKVLFDLKEKLVEAVKDKHVKKLGIFKQAALAYKELFFEKGRHSEGREVVANYVDSTNKEARVLAETYVQQGMDKKEAFAEAKAKVLERYSTDINRDLNAVLLQAALHRTRTRVEPIARTLEDYFKTIKTATKDGKDRTKAIAKLNNWMDRIVLNRTEKNRGAVGSVLGTDWKALQSVGKKLSRIPIIGSLFFTEKSFSLLSEPEKIVLKELEKLKKEGYNEDANFQIFVEGNVFIKDSGHFYKRDKESDEIVEIGKEEFDGYYGMYLEEKVDKLGLDANLAGLIQGFLKIKIIASLGLNYTSGIFNRIEGKNSGLMMDEVGYFWKSGNIHEANQFLVGANMLKYTPDMMTPKWVKKYKEIEKLKAFGEILSTLQDRKNVLERSAESAEFDTSKLNIYQFAVENPEFKNQMAIAVAIMMDVDITHPITGVTTKMFQNGGFPAHDLVNGQLVLKTDYRSAENIKNWEDFNGADTLDLKLKITNAVNKSQGNYDPSDVIMLTSTIIGRAVSLFMKWLPAQVKQRYSAGTGDDIYTGKKNLQGRYVATVLGSRGASVVTPIVSMGIMWGMFGIPIALLSTVGIVGGSLVASMVFHKMISKFASKEELKRESNAVMEGLDFLHAILVQTINYPLDLTNISGIKINGTKLRLKNAGLKHTKNLTPHQAASIQATAKELAIMLTMLSVKVALASLMYDPDDREDDEKRMFYYWLQNQLTKGIKSIGMYSTTEFFNDVTRLAMMGVVQDLYSVASAIWDEDERDDLGKNTINLLAPVPKSITRGRAPWLDTKDFNMFTGPFGNAVGLKWTAVKAKDVSSDGEYTEEKRYRRLRAELREEVTEELRAEGYRGQELTDKIDEVLYQRYPKKKRGDSYKTTVEKTESSVTRYE